MSAGRRPIYYGWLVVAVSFLTVLIGLGIRYSFSVFFVAILDEMHWGRGETAGAFSLAMIMHSAAAPFTGYIVDRFGPRLLFPLGAIFLGTGLALGIWVDKLWHLYCFYGLVIALGVNALSFTPHMAVVSRWFVRRRGLASGLVLAGIGLGGLVMAPLAQLLITRVGWRAAFGYLALGVLGLIAPGTFFIHRRGPEEMGLLPDGDLPDKGASAAPGAAGKPPGAWKLTEALRSRPFWQLMTANACFGFLLNMLIVHQGVFLVDLGFSPHRAAAMIGAAGLVAGLSGVGAGWFSDRFGRKAAFTIGSFFLLGAVSNLLLIEGRGPTGLAWIYVVAFGLGYGALPPLHGSMTGDVFGGANIGRILGLLAVGFGLGGALGAYVGGYFFDRFHSYHYALLLLLASSVISWVSFCRVRTGPGEDPV